MSYLITLQLEPRDKHGFTVYKIWKGTTPEAAKDKAYQETFPPPSPPAQNPVVEPGIGSLILRNECPPPDAEKQAAANATQKPMRDTAQTEWFSAASPTMFDAVGHTKADRLVGGVCLHARDYESLRGSLHLCTRVCPNPYTKDAVMERRFLVLKFNDTNLNRAWKLIMSLGDPRLVVLCVSGPTLALEAWFDTRKMSESDQRELGMNALLLGCEPACMDAKWKAATPNGASPGADDARTFAALKAAGVLRDQSQFNQLGLSKKNLVLWMSPATKDLDDNLPTVPPKGRRN